MKKYVLVSAAASLALLMGAGCAGSSNYSVTPPEETQGRAVITVTDASTDPAVTAVVVTVNKVEVHSAASDWTTVSTATKTYDLIKLKADGVSALLADVNLDAGVYDQVRLNISNVSVTADGKTSTAKLPSSVLKLVGNLKVVAGETSTASLDFDVDKSLHLTGNGLYILAPVVKWQTTTSADVTIKTDESVEVDGEKVETDEVEGVDVDGETKMNFELPEKLDVDANGKIHVNVE